MLPMMKLVILFLACSLQLKAQLTDTLEHEIPNQEQSIASKEFQPYYIPTFLIGYGAVSLGNNPLRDLDRSSKAELAEDNPVFHTTIDDYLQFSPIAAVYALNIIGVKGKNAIIDQTNMVLLTTLFTTAFTYTIKKQTNRLRPNEAAYNSFPSGHTATAFAAADLLHHEFKHQSVWYGYLGYAAATTTGILRMYNNKHWLSDVVAGAGFGLLSTRLTYFVYPYLKRMVAVKETDLAVNPVFQKGMLGLSLKYKPAR